MSALDRDVLAEKLQAVRRHLTREADRLPADAAAFQPSSDASDAVVLRLWRATQIVIDVALAACVRLNLGTPNGCADVFRRLQAAGMVDAELGDRLARAAGFRNTIALAYESLDMARVYRAAKDGPRDLLAFLSRVRDSLPVTQPADGTPAT